MAGELIGSDWLEARLADGPPVLVRRTRDFIAQAGLEGALPERLARASRLALARAVADPVDRRAALDLLAADALVTLALAARVEGDPSDPAALARAVRRAAEVSG